MLYQYCPLLQVNWIVTNLEITFISVKVLMHFRKAREGALYNIDSRLLHAYLTEQATYSSTTYKTQAFQFNFKSPRKPFNLECATTLLSVVPWPKNGLSTLSVFCSRTAGHRFTASFPNSTCPSLVSSFHGESCQKDCGDRWFQNFGPGIV